MPKVPDNYFEGRKCCKCGKDKTSWNWYKYRVKGVWDGKSYLCINCWKIEYHKNVQKLNPYSHNNIIKSMADFRTGNLRKDSETGKSIIDQAIVAKIFQSEDLNIKMDNLGWYIDIENKEFGKIDVKGAKISDDGWMFNNRRKIECDTYVCLGYDRNRENIDKIWIIYNEDDITNIGNIHIRINSIKYEKFEIDNTLYNDVYHSLVSRFKDKRYFGIEDVKKWIKL